MLIQLIECQIESQLTLTMIFLRRISTPIPTTITTLYTKTIHRVSNRFYFAETSRQIEQKMRIQRNKSLHNKFKSLNSSFGIKRPTKIQKQFVKPSTIEYSIESLRLYSHMYPQFLLNELNNQKSQFYEVIQDSFTGLATVQNKQSIEFLQFMVKWKIYLHDEQYQEVLIRKMYQMKLNLGQLFSILKFIIDIEKKDLKLKLMTQIQSKILNKIIDIDQSEYESLFKILNFMRINDLSPKIKPQVLDKLKQIKLKNQSSQNEDGEYTQDSFYKVVETLLLRNLQTIPLPNLVEMIIHYANNTKQQQDDKIMILGKVQAKVLQNFPFFNHDQLIAIMYSYIKTNTHSQKLVNQFINRIQLLYFEISWENKRKILSLSSSFDHNKWIQIVGLSIFEVLKGKKVIYRDGNKQVDPQAKQVEFQLLPSIYLSAYQTNLATPQLIDKLQTRILEQIFNYPSEDVGLIAWLFTITPLSLKPKHDNKDLLHTKLESIISGGFNSGTFSLKDISMVVWSLCNSGGKSNAIYKQNADFWKNIQSYIQERIGNEKEERLFNGCCQILWAYGNNKALSIKTINMIIDLIVAKQSKNQLINQMFNFELTTLTSFFYSLRDNLPQSINQFFEKLSVKYFIELVDTMDYLQIMKMLKYSIYDNNNKISQNKIPHQLWTKVLEQFQLSIDFIQYSSIMGVVGFTIVSPQGQKTQKKAVEIVTKLMARKKRLEQLKKTTDEDK